MQNWLITGGEGFIGSKIAILTGVHSYDLKSGKDILNVSQLSQACVNVEGIFHCAAKISVPESVQSPEEYYLHNVVGTRNLIEAVKIQGTKIVFSSSAAVYGESAQAVSEEDSLNPQSPYAQNKVDGENLLREYSTRSVILRYFNVYGPGQSPAYAGVITAFITAAVEGKDLVIYGNGEQVRDFVYVDDVARANVMAMESSFGNGEVFNIATSEMISLNNLARTILKITQSPSKIVYAELRPGDIVFSQGKSGKAKQLLGWKAEVSLEQGLEKTIKSYKHHE